MGRVFVYKYSLEREHNSPVKQSSALLRKRSCKEEEKRTVKERKSSHYSTMCSYRQTEQSILKQEHSSVLQNCLS